MTIKELFEKLDTANELKDVFKQCTLSINVKFRACLNNFEVSVEDYNAFLDEFAYWTGGNSSKGLEDTEIVFDDEGFGEANFNGVAISFRGVR